MAYNAERSKQFNLALDRFVEEYQQVGGYSGTTGYLMGVMMTMFHDLSTSDQEMMIRYMENRAAELAPRLADLASDSNHTVAL